MKASNDAGHPGLSLEMNYSQRAAENLADTLLLHQHEAIKSETVMNK